MPILLITLSDIQDRYDVSANAVNSRAVNGAILRAQESGLMFVLGKSLYDRVIAEINTPSTAIEALLPLITPYVAAKSYAIMLADNGIAVSGFGVAKKQSDVMALVSQEDINAASQTIEREAIDMANLLLQFIRDNITDYPEFQNNTQWPLGGQPAGVRFVAVSPSANPNA